MRIRGTPLEFIAELFGIEDNSAYKFFRYGVMAIVLSRDLFIDPDPFGSRRKLMALANGFNNGNIQKSEDNARLRGALDRIVMQIMKPEHPTQLQFHNRKGFFALVTQAPGGDTPSLLPEEFWIAVDAAHTCTMKAITPYSVHS